MEVLAAPIAPRLTLDGVREVLAESDPAAASARLASLLRLAPRESLVAASVADWVHSALLDAQAHGFRAEAAFEYARVALLCLDAALAEAPAWPSLESNQALSKRLLLERLDLAGVPSAGGVSPRPAEPPAALLTPEQIEVVATFLATTFHARWALFRAVLTTPEQHESFLVLRFVDTPMRLPPLSAAREEA